MEHKNQNISLGCVELDQEIKNSKINQERAHENDPCSSGSSSHHVAAAGAAAEAIAPKRVNQRGAQGVIKRKGSYFSNESNPYRRGIEKAARFMAQQVVTPNSINTNILEFKQWMKDKNYGKESDMKTNRNREHENLRMFARFMAEKALNADSE